MSGPASNNEAQPESSGGGCGWVLLALGVGVLGLVMFLMPGSLPIQVRPRSGPGGHFRPCISNLRQIDAAKEQWALENRKPIGEQVPPVGVAMYLKNSQLPVCWSTNAAYDVGRVGEAPVCLNPEHTLSWLAPCPWLGWFGAKDPWQVWAEARDAAATAGKRVVCGTNLRFIDAAKAYWAQRRGQKPGAVPPEEALFGPRVFGVSRSRYHPVRLFGLGVVYQYETDWYEYVPITKPTCPSGGVYSIGAIGEAARCSLPDHAR